MLLHNFETTEYEIKEKKLIVVKLLGEPALGLYL